MRRALAAFEETGGVLFSREGEMRRLLLIAVLLGVPAAASAAEPNLVELHKTPGTAANTACLACHQDIGKQTGLNTRIKTFHRLHLESKRETPKQCTECHASVDLRESSAAALRKQVDPQLCAGCHSGGLKGAKTLFAK
jgi:predicted CXXCH cytochrome family protein